MEKIQNRLRSLFKLIMRTSLINRWIVFEIDLLTCIAGYGIAAFIQMRNSNMDITGSRLFLAGVVFILSTSVCFYTLKPYRGLIRHSSLIEMWRLFVSLLISTIVLYAFILSLGYSFSYRFFFVQNVFLISLVMLLLLRYTIVLVYNYTVNYTTEVRNKSLIYEIDMHSIALAQWLNKSAANKHQVQGFVTRNKNAKKNPDSWVTCTHLKRRPVGLVLT